MDAGIAVAEAGEGGDQQLCHQVVRRGQPDAALEAQVAAGARHISFGDPDFFNGPGHALRVVQVLHARHPDLTWDATIKIEHIVKYPDEIRALGETVVRGIKTNGAYLRRLLAHPAFVAGDYHTGTAEGLAQSSDDAPLATLSPELIDVAFAAMAVNTYQRDARTARSARVAHNTEPSRQSGWRTPLWRMRNG